MTVLTDNQSDWGIKEDYGDLGVLVVEDAASVRRYVVSCLNPIGMRMYETDDGDKAFAFLKENPGMVDLVITDLVMHRMHGDELCQKIRNELGMTELPVIVLSAHRAPETIVKLFQAGATDYLFKPFGTEELVARIQVHLKTRLLYLLLKDQNETLHELGRMKDDFLAICSHDMRSPLTAIIGYSDLMLTRGGLSEEDRERAEHIFSAGQDLLAMISDILDLGQIASESNQNNLIPVQLALVLQSCIQTLRYTAKSKDISISQAVWVPDAVVKGSKNGYIRIFNNLISNAIKYTPHGGSVKVSLEKGDPGRVDVVVSDTGIGIPDEKMALLFQKYAKFSDTGTAGEPSTGLGLMIVKELLDQFGGEISVSSIPGKGSTFRLRLPLLELNEGDQKAPLPETAADVGVRTGAHSVAVGDSSPTVTAWIVEDNPVNIKLIKAFLKEEPIRIDVAENGRRAIERFRALAEKEEAVPDLILMDLNMPELDGIAAATEIRLIEERLLTDQPRVLIWAMTASVTAEQKRACLEAGMDDYIVKPVDRNQFVQKIRMLIQSLDFDRK